MGGCRGRCTLRPGSRCGSGCRQHDWHEFLVALPGAPPSQGNKKQGQSPFRRFTSIIRLVDIRLLIMIIILHLLFYDCMRVRAYERAYLRYMTLFILVIIIIR